MKPRYWGEMRDISYKKGRGSLIDKPLEQSESLSERKALARHMLYKRKSFENGGTTSDRIKELENIKKLLFPLIKDFESADLYEKASEELKLLKKQQ